MRYLIDADRAGAALLRRRDFYDRLRRTRKLRGERHKNGKRRKQKAEQRHGKRDNEDRAPNREAHGDAANAEGGESQPSKAGERERARGWFQDVRCKIRG